MTHEVLFLIVWGFGFIFGGYLLGYIHGMQHGQKAVLRYYKAQLESFKKSIPPENTQ